MHVLQPTGMYMSQKIGISTISIRRSPLMFFSVCHFSRTVLPSPVLIARVIPCHGVTRVPSVINCVRKLFLHCGEASKPYRKGCAASQHTTASQHRIETPERHTCEHDTRLQTPRRQQSSTPDNGLHPRPHRTSLKSTRLDSTRLDSTYLISCFSNFSAVDSSSVMRAVMLLVHRGSDTRDEGQDGQTRRVGGKIVHWRADQLDQNSTGVWVSARGQHRGWGRRFS